MTFQNLGLMSRAVVIHVLALILWPHSRKKTRGRDLTYISTTLISIAKSRRARRTVEWG